MEVIYPMENLNRQLLTNGFKFNDDLKIGTKKTLSEKIVQFGEGNFLRAFVDYMFDEINEQGLFEGGITLIQPIPGGDFLRNVLNEQEGLYTLLLLEVVKMARKLQLKDLLLA